MPEKPLEMQGDQPGSDASISTNRPPFHRCSREGEDDPLARSGRPVSGPPRSRPITASQETCHACRARSPHLGKMPAASTEVVLAERLNSARPGAARLGGTFLSSLIPVLVTGIQRAQVLGHGRIISRQYRVIHGADAPWLDSCDKHRNEGGGWRRATPPSSPARGVLSAAYLECALPPSVLPDISPTRGEIGKQHDRHPTSIVWRKALGDSISLLVGEMSGRTEGGVTRSAAEKCALGTSHDRAVSLRGVWA